MLELLDGFTDGVNATEETLAIKLEIGADLTHGADVKSLLTGLVIGVAIPIAGVLMLPSLVKLLSLLI
jgi:hypothetical protein